MIGYLLSIQLVFAAQSAAPAQASVPALPSIPAAMPADVVAAFGSAEGALAKVSACVGESGVITPQRLAALDRRLQALRRQASGVWGPDALLALASAAATPTDCARDGGATALGTAAEQQLTQLTAKLNHMLSPMRTGVWFGTMPLCGRGPVGADLMVDVYSADPFLLITLSPATAADLATLTTRHVGHQLAFRAGGRVVAEPQVNEPISGGQLQLGGPPLPELERAAAVIKSCGKPAA